MECEQASTRNRRVVTAPRGGRAGQAGATGRVGSSRGR